MKIILFNFLIFFLFIGGSCDKENGLPENGENDIPENGEDDPASDFVKESHHPFLIVKKEQFDYLRERAGTEPWKSIKDDALLRSARGSATSAYPLQDFVGAAALAYILDTVNAETHAHRVRDAILDQYSEIKVEDGGGWGGVVPPMGSFFNAILALDIVYNTLSPEDIEACEEVISDQISKISRNGSWGDVRLGTHGTWDIYKGDRTTPDDNYYNGIMVQITEDGVSPVTNHYAWERVAGGDSRLSKSGYMDVLEFTGIDNRYYNNDRLKKFFRWLFGSSVNCAKEMAIFGDMLPTQGINNDMLHRRVGNFDSEAAGYAAWFHEGVEAKGNILTYILPWEPLPPPVVPESAIYTNGGAFFREKEDDPGGLHGVLYNIMSQDEWHTHQEVNGLALSGMGNRVLVNGGRLGAPTRPAPLNNTLTINGESHNSRLGGGIVEGFTMERFDYASGYSGPAMTGGAHYRNLVLMHGAGEARPYYVVFDEVETAAGNTINNFIHPANETTVSVLRANELYDTEIDHFPTVQGTNLLFFYVTPPDNVDIMKVPSAVPERYPDYPDHNRLESIYQTGTSGMKNVITVLQPYDQDPGTELQRFDGTGFTGGKVSHGLSVTDYILESAGDEIIQSDDVSLKAKAAIWREIQDETDFYFVREGTRFIKDSSGFESDLPVSLYMDGSEGVILSGGARIKLTWPGIDLAGFHDNVDIIESGEGFIEIQAGEGEIRFSY